MIHNRKIIYLTGFIFSLPIALMSYINSSFMVTFISERSVGTVYALGSIASVLALLIAPRFFRTLGGYKFLLSVIALDSLSIILFAFSKNAWSAVPMFVLGFTFNILIMSSMDEFLKISSKESSIGRIRGLYLAICNVAWITALLAFGTFLGGFTFRTIYLVSFSFMLLFFIISYFRLRNIPDPEYDNLGTKEYLGGFFRNKNLFRSYVMGLLIQFFYCWMVIYTPIYLSAHLGFSWKEIGIIFSVMLLPFSIIPFHLGKYADKIGERKILMWGFFIAGLATISLFFIGIHEVWIWALLLFMTRVGAATIEVGVESYFFKHIKPENEEFVSVFRSTVPVAYIIGPILAFFTLSYVPAFNFIFLVLGAFMIYGVYLSSMIRKSDI